MDIYTKYRSYVNHGSQISPEISDLTQRGVYVTLRAYICPARQRKGEEIHLYIYLEQSLEMYSKYLNPQVNTVKRS